MKSTYSLVEMLIKKYNIEVSKKDLEELTKKEMFHIMDAWTDGFNSGMIEAGTNILSFHNWRSYYEEKFNNGK
jgi:hypothetical protein